MTCHRNVTRDSRVTTPVSHGTNTTPHHTMSLVAVACGVSGSGFHPSNGDLRLGDAAKADELRLLGGGF